MAVRLMEIIFDVWKTKKIQYLDEIILEYASNGPPTENIPVPIWNTKDIPIPQLLWDNESTPDQERSILKHLQGMMHEFRWFQNTSSRWVCENGGESDQSCVIIGNVLNAPVPRNNLLLGLMLIKPNNVYPAHAHDAKEAYYILAGSCYTKKNADEFQEKRAGDVIIHEPREAHALETKDDPVLIVWANTGIIFGEYYFID